MKSLISLILARIFLLLFCLVGSLSAQENMMAHTGAAKSGENASLPTGNIAGLIRDAKTNETIIGANVVLKGTNIGSSTNLDGKFEIANLQPGKYDLVISFISYKTQQVQGVQVSRGRTTMLDLKLDENTMMIEGVQVSAKKVNNTDISMLSAIKKSELVVSGISAQQISKSQDNDAAMVIKRIPGVTVLDGRFIMIRGLSERYNPTMLHNVFAPSMEADIRSFSFDVIPSSLIDQIMIYKSPAADLPGEFGGGVVKIFTKNVPDENRLTVSYTSSYEPGTSFNDFYHPKTNPGHFLGIINSKLYLPESFPDNLRKIKNETELEGYGRSLQNNWVAEKSNAGLNHSALINKSLQFKVGRLHFGNISSVSYSNSKSIDQIQRRDYNLFDPAQQLSSLIFRFNDIQNNQNIRVGILHNWALNIGKNHSIEFKNLYNQISRTQYVHRTGPHLEFNYFADNHAFYQLYRGIYTGQVAGRHKFFSQRTAVDWVAGYGYSYRHEPDYRRYRSDRDTVDQSLTTYVPFGAAASYFLGRFYSDMYENNYSASLNIKHQFKTDGLTAFKPEVTLGFFYEDKDRGFSARNLGYVRSNSYLFNSGLLNVGIDSLFHPSNINNRNGIRIDEQTNPSDSYTAQNSLYATYLQALLPVTYKLRFVAGVRLEYHRQQFKSHSMTNIPVTVDNPVLSVLPSASLSYHFSQKALMRLTYGKTVNRPEFRELAPFGFYDFNYNLVKKGNEYLKSASIHNFDLRYEYYPSASEVLLFGVFHKNFTNPIEASFIPGGGTAGIKTFSYSNANTARSSGLEVEARKALKGITTSKFINDFTLLFNAAIIQSKVDLGDASLGQKFTERQMQGQSPYIINAGIYYFNEKASLNVNVLYNLIGKRIFMIGYDDYPDVYEMPRNLLDITITKKVAKNLEIKAGIRDILNNEFLLLQDGNQDGNFDHNADQAIERYLPGRVFSLGVSWNM